MSNLLDSIFNGEDDQLGEITVPTDQALASIGGMVQRSLDLEAELETLYLQVGEKVNELTKLKEELIPAAMSSAGTTMFKALDGSLVEIDTQYYASINDQNREEAHQWLRDTGRGSLIKNEFKVNFGKGEDGQAAKFNAFLTAKKVPFTQKEGVHHSTLGAFVKECYESGVNFPEKLLGAFTKKVASIKKPKVKKEKHGV